MASDSAMTDGDHLLTMRVAKFHLVCSKHNPDMLIGYAGRAKAGQALLDLHAVKMPKDETPDPYIFITQTLVPILGEVLGHYRLAYESEVGETCHDNIFLIAYRGRLFAINQEFYVYETSDNFAVIGSGEDYALGAMTALQTACPNMTPEDLIQAGMNVAIKYSSSVRGPIKAMEVPTSKILSDPEPPKKAKENKRKKPLKKDKKKITPKKTSLID